MDNLDINLNEKLKQMEVNNKIEDKSLEKLDSDNNIVYHIIGGGPVGFAVALLLAKKGIPSKIFESRNEILNDYEQSYPIGINSRTLHTLGMIDEKLKEEAISTGLIIDAWEIYSGTRRVAVQESGTVYGTSRAKVNLLLYEVAKKEKLISIFYNHKLVGLDHNKKELTFLNKNDNKTVVLMAKKVIACDGVNSVARNYMNSNDKNFKSETIPWTNEFRILFAKPNEGLDILNEKIHYINSGTYCGVIMNEKDKIWSLSLSLNDNDSDEYRNIFLSNDPSEENIKALKSIIKTKMPFIYPLFENNEDELKKYFKRKSYRGAVIGCNKLNMGEWILLMGDAAHSVLPPTGEGINSGLEDAYVLYDTIIKYGEENLFKNYNNERLKDLEGLFEYAKYLNDNSQFPGEQGSRIMFMILSSCFKRKVFNELFGRESSKRLPYSDIMSSWQRKKFWLLNFSRCICYPISMIFFVLTPWRWGICCKKKNVKNELKPPIS